MTRCLTVQIANIDFVYIEGAFKLADRDDISRENYPGAQALTETALFTAIACSELAQIHCHIAENKEWDLTKPFKQDHWRDATEQLIADYLAAFQRANDYSCTSIPMLFDRSAMYALEVQTERRVKKRERQQRRQSGQSKTRAGYVYLILADSGHYKIGRSVNPDDRMKTFQLTLPFEVEFEHIVQCDDMVMLERELHQRFDHQRVNGEWFDLSPDDVDYIKSLGGEM